MMFSNRIWTILIILVSLIPLYRLSAVVFTVGENNLSNDYVAFVGTIIPIINGDISLNSLGQTCFRGQCEPITFFVLAFLVKISQWNVYVELAYSLLVSFITVMIIFFSVSSITFNPKKLWIIIFVSAFSFSLTLISTFTFGQAAIYSTHALLGICLGFLSVKLFANTYKGILLLILGMIISAWSYGGGLLSIPILFIGLLIGFRTKKVFYLTWLGSLILISVPYIQYFSANETASSAVEFISLFRATWVINLIGLFFSNGMSFPYPGKEIIFTSNPMIYGYLGIIFLIIGVVFTLWIYGIKNIYRFYSELGLIAFGLGSAWQISVIRAGIVPWYVVNVLPFWIGLVCLYFSLVNNGEFAQRIVPWFARRSAFAFFLLVTILYIHSNIEYGDKVFHLLSRAPVSASCLRNYQKAPTYCEPFLFQWEPGNPVLIQALGNPLDMNHLSVFASSQEWSLQGDYILNSVQIYPSKSGKKPYWIDNEGNISSWSDYHRLDLVLPPTSTIEWNLDMPKDLIDAKFLTLAKLNSVNGEEESRQSEFVVEINISTPDDGAKSVHLFSLSNKSNSDGWIPIELPLTEFEGRRLSISITTRTIADGVPVSAVLQYPKIGLELLEAEVETVNQYYPENIVDITNKPILFQFFPADTNYPLNTYYISYNNLLFDQTTNVLSNILGKNGNISIQNNGNFCVSNDSKFYMTVMAEKGVSANKYYSTVVFNFIATDRGTSSSQIILPFLNDGEIHTYIYPLKLLEDPSYITGVEIIPMANNDNIDYEIHDIGFYNDGITTNRCLGPNVVDILPKEPAGEIIKQYKVSQTFTAECDGLTQVQLLFATYKKKNSHPIIIEIFKIEDSESSLIHKEIVPPNILNDNSWYATNFHEIEGSENLTFRVDISSPESTIGDAVTVWQSDEDVYPQGSEFINDVAVNKDVSFRYACLITP
jgi:hypothetical protein